MRLITAVLDALAAYVRVMFEVGLSLARQNLDSARQRRRERERQRQDGARE